MSDIETQAPEDVPGIDRRVFMGLFSGGLGGAALVGATAAVAWPGEASATATSEPLPAGDEMGEMPGGHSGMAGDMDAMHKEGIDQFLANIESPITKGAGATDLEYRVEGGVRVFELTVGRVEWEVTPGQVEQAIAYNGIVPGPTIRVRRRRAGPDPRPERAGREHRGALARPAGPERPWTACRSSPSRRSSRARPSPTSSSPGRSAATCTTRTTTRPSRSAKGLLGALIVEPQRPARPSPPTTRTTLYILNDVLGGFTINGKGFPATPAYSAKQGERVRFRFMNEGVMVHPMHLHGLTFEVFARDGYPLPQPFLCDTITVAPGERWDAIVVADSPGAWAFHCHILSHAESPQGMFGMVTALIVE